MGIIAFVLLGMGVGALAKAILPGDDPGGAIVTTMIGVAGSVLGGFMAGVLFDMQPVAHFFDASTWITAVIGSLVLLAVFRLAVGGGGARSTQS